MIINSSFILKERKPQTQDDKTQSVSEPEFPKEKGKQKAKICAGIQNQFASQFQKLGIVLNLSIREIIIFSKSSGTSKESPLRSPECTGEAQGKASCCKACRGLFNSLSSKLSKHKKSLQRKTIKFRPIGSYQVTGEVKELIQRLLVQNKVLQKQNFALTKEVLKLKKLVKSDMQIKVFLSFFSNQTKFHC